MTPEGSDLKAYHYQGPLRQIAGPEAFPPELDGADAVCRMLAPLALAASGDTTPPAVFLRVWPQRDIGTCTALAPWFRRHWHRADKIHVVFDGEPAAQASTELTSCQWQKWVQQTDLVKRIGQVWEPGEALGQIQQYMQRGCQQFVVRGARFVLTFLETGPSFRDSDCALTLLLPPTNTVHRLMLRREPQREGWVSPRVRRMIYRPGKDSRGWFTGPGTLTLWTDEDCFEFIEEKMASSSAGSAKCERKGENAD